MRLIDADAMKERFCDGVGAEPLDWVYDVNDLEGALAEMPTIDAVPVVRCRDCKKGWPAGEYVYCMKPYAGHWPTHKWDWYCADAERKEDAK